MGRTRIVTSFMIYLAIKQKTRFYLSSEYASNLCIKKEQGHLNLSLKQTFCQNITR